MRNKFRDVENRETITRLEEVMDNRNVSILWHVKCYSLFTSKDKIRRLENRINKGETCTKPISSPRKTHTQIKQVDWDKCVFCPY